MDQTASACGPPRSTINFKPAKGSPALSIERVARDQPDGDAPIDATVPPGSNGSPTSQRLAAVTTQVTRLARAISEGDAAMVEDAVLQLSRSRRIFAPLAFAVGALAMLFEGVRLLFSNWRLMLVQLLPAMWIWVALLDLKAHVLHGKSFHVLRGPILIPIILAIVSLTAASFFLNAVFAFAIAGSPPPKIRPAFAEARAHHRVVLTSGAVVGLLLGLSTMVVTRWGSLWFALSLSIVLGVMMVCYVAVPSRLIGMKPAGSKRDKLTASAVGGTIGAVVCTPPYVLGRIGLLMLGSQLLFIPGVIVLVLGFVLQAAATSSVKAVKMSAKLAAPRPPTSERA